MLKKLFGSKPARRVSLADGSLDFEVGRIDAVGAGVAADDLEQELADGGDGFDHGGLRQGEVRWSLRRAWICVSRVPRNRDRSWGE